jgi:two-component sensor histidine kinase/tetratricopeptide (TPR) repeat protein
MKRILFFLFLLSQFAYGQKSIYHNLVQRLPVENTDTVKLQILAQLTDLAFTENLDTALNFARQGVALAEKINNKSWRFLFDDLKGKMHSYLLQFDSAKVSLNKAIEGYRSSNNKRGEAEAAFQLAWVLKRSGEQQKAMESDINALRLMEEINDQQGIAKGYERVSDGLSRQGRKDESVNYGIKSIEVCEKNNLTNEMAHAWFNMGNVYIAMNNKKTAFEYYHKAVEKGRSLGFEPVFICHFTVGRGNALKRLERYTEALKDYNYVLTLSKKINYVNAIAVAIANLGEVNLLLGNYKEALGYQLETVRLQEKDSNFNNLTENYRHVSTIYEKLGNYQQALAYEQKAGSMRDRVASAESDTAMSRLLTQYEAEKKQATIAAQDNQISQQKKVQWLSIGVVALLAGFLIIGYRNLRQRNKNNKLLAAKNAENELLLKEIHHRVKNNLEVVSSLLALQSAQIDDPNTKEAMLEGQNRVQSIGIVHQKLYQGENLGAIEMKDYFINLSESILDSFGADKKVQIECVLDNLNIDIDRAVPLGLIVNELLTNTLKYAFPDGRNGKVKIKWEKRPDGILQLLVADNGVGKSGVTRGTGFGGQLLALLTKQLGGSMKEEISNGTNVFFEFKIDKAA